MENSTTDFEFWFDSNVDSGDISQVWEVYTVTESRDSEQGNYKSSSNGEMTFVKNTYSNSSLSTLILASEKARGAFLNWLDYSHSEHGGVYGAYQWEKAMNKDD